MPESKAEEELKSIKRRIEVAKKAFHKNPDDEVNKQAYSVIMWIETGNDEYLKHK